MRTYVIVINWAFSLFGLGIESTSDSLLPSLFGFAWFALSSCILIRANKKGRLRKFEKPLKIDEL